jgi:hypothetical protein
MVKKITEVGISQTIHYRNYRRARDRALARLSKLYPNLYKDLLQEEREIDEQEGTIWNLAGDGKLNVITTTRKINARSGRSTSNNRTNKGNNGGEA